MRIRLALLVVLGVLALASSGPLTMALRASSDNLIANPGFETGDLSGWSCSGGLGSVVDSPVHSGSHALAGAAGDQDNAKCWQTVSVSPSTHYKLSAFVEGGYVFLGVEGTGTNDPLNWISTPGAYQQLSVDFTTGGSTNSVTVYVHGWYAQGTYHADDFSLPASEGPTPSPTQPPTPGAGSCSAPAWDSTHVYWGGDQASFQGHTWKARWWTQGETPGKGYVWADQGSCKPSPTPSPSPSSVPSPTPTASPSGTPSPPPHPVGAMASPYLYMGWGNPPSPSAVMSATGIKSFMMAFMLASGGCNPAWDGNRPLQGGPDEKAIQEIRGAGGDVIPSFGGWQGNKLGPNCPDAPSLAGAYQKVIDAYGLRAIDLDIENSDELENEAVQDRILGALKIVKQRNPELKTIVTIGTTTTGPNFFGTRLIKQAAALQANIDIITIMPFDFGGGSDMFGSTVSAAEGLKSLLMTTFGWSDTTAYGHMGISGMNGLSDQQEQTTPAVWTQIRDWANAHHLARLAIWSVNRDRGCPGMGVNSSCSGITQADWEFTRITAGFTG